MTWPVDRWLVKLAEGWRLDWIVQPIGGAHTPYSVLLLRDDPPEVTP